MENLHKKSASTMEIDNILNDYTMRELQSISSTILSNHNATSNFIKQFNADHDSQQFYKNVITWYVKQYNVFPEISSLTFHFTPNMEGLGDRFISVSIILSLMDAFNRDSIVYCFASQAHTPQEQILYEDFYEIVDFFHFKRPKNKITTEHNTVRSFGNCIDTNPLRPDLVGYSKHPPNDTMPHRNYNLCNAFQKMSAETWVNGSYWPIDFSPKEKEKNVCYMFYTDIDRHHNTHGKHTKKKQREKFKTLTETFPEITFYQLEDFNFSRNVEILSKSNFIFATEGMWTHLSRAMKVNTIAHTTNVEINKEINDQGHYSSPRFDKCLDKVKNLCTDLMK